MAALIKCKACGAAVSKKAPSCPQCGEPLKRKPMGCGSGLVLIFLVIVIGVAVTQMGSGPSSVGTTSTPSKPPSQPAGGPSASRNAVAASLFSEYGQAERLDLLATSVRSSGSPCTNATREMYIGLDQDNAAYWSVACSDGGDYMVTVKNDGQGSTSVAECSLLRAVNVACWKKFQ